MSQRATIELRVLHAGLMYSTSLTDTDFAYEYTPMVSPQVSPREERRRRRSEDVGHRTWTLEEVNKRTNYIYVVSLWTPLGWPGGSSKMIQFCVTHKDRGYGKSPTVHTELSQTEPL